MSSDPILRVRDLEVHHRSMRSRGGHRRAPIAAVRGVSFELARGETLAIVGESGSGKTTMARALVRLVESTAGSIELGGVDITRAKGRILRRAYQDLQMVFQDPMSSLDPTMTVSQIIEEPLKVHLGLRGAVLADRVADLLVAVGLSPDDAHRMPYEFSGGQQQRVAIARALAVDPAVIVCDEAVSALDVSTRAHVIAILQQLQVSSAMSYVFISHDLSAVGQIADRVAVMYLGQIVELGDVRAVLEHPEHPYTQRLLAAVPRLDPWISDDKPERLHGEIPDPAALPPGCSFHPRCSWRDDTCSSSVEVLAPTSSTGSHVRCHVAAPAERPGADDPTGRQDSSIERRDDTRAVQGQTGV